MGEPLSEEEVAALRQMVDDWWPTYAKRRAASPLYIESAAEVLMQDIGVALRLPCRAPT